jgi:hypothetical protein
MGRPSRPRGLPAGKWGRPRARRGVPRRKRGRPSRKNGRPRRKWGRPPAKKGRPRENWGRPRRREGRPSGKRGCPCGFPGRPRGKWGRGWKRPAGYGLPGHGANALLEPCPAAKHRPIVGSPRIFAAHFFAAHLDVRRHYAYGAEHIHKAEKFHAAAHCAALTVFPFRALSVVHLRFSSFWPHRYAALGGGSSQDTSRGVLAPHVRPIYDHLLSHVSHLVYRSPSTQKEIPCRLTMRCSEPAGASRWPSLRPVRRVAEPGALGRFTRMKNPWRILLVAVLFLPLLYVGSYFLSVQPSIWVQEGNGETAIPGYRYFPSSAMVRVNQFYWPLHKLDRTYLRRHKWERQSTSFRSSL